MAMAMMTTTKFYLCLLLVLSSWVEAQTETRNQTEPTHNLRRHDDVMMPMKKPRIINGKEVLVPRYPYFSLMYGRSLCGGVLIGPRLVLSAAHCEDASTQFRIGAFENPNDGEKVNIRSTIVHPDYDVSRFDNDIIIFQLETDVNLPYIQLGSDYVRDGSYTVIGFGDTDKGQDLVLSSTLQEVELEYVDSDKCDDGHGDRDEVKEDMLCAAGKNKDSCIGDSGGPLIKKGANSYDDTLVGLVSWGRGCAEDGVPGVYSRISYFYDWIVETVCDNYADDAPYYMSCGLNPSVFVFTNKPTEAPSKQERITSSPTKLPTASTPTQMLTRPLLPISPVSTLPDTIANNTMFPIDLRKDIEFVAWTPTVELQDCQGDCDTDDDCRGDFLCFKRNGEAETYEVPGCKSPELIANSVDVCINPTARI